MTRSPLRSLTVGGLLTEHRRRSLHAFVKGAWHLVEPDTPFVDNWHIRLLCRYLEKVTAGEIRRLLINIPPGTAKSLIVSVFWPAWEWIQHPGRRWLTASYSADLALRDAGKMRTIVESRWYQEQWPTLLKDDQNAKGQFETQKGGWRIATSVKGKGTGLHPDRVVVDDPHTVAQAEAPTGTERQEAIDWFQRTITTRGASRNASHVVVMQRIHQQDLSGWILEHGNASAWVHLCLPMRAESPDALPKTAAQRPVGVDPRKPGELLWPELFSAAIVNEQAKTLGSVTFAGQFQQRPSPAGGALFKRGNFTMIHAWPTDLVAVSRGWDAAGTEDAGDYTAGVKMGKRRSGTFVVLHVTRGKWSTFEVDNRIKQTAYSDGPQVRVREEQEPGSAGKAVVRLRARQLPGYDYVAKPSTGAKVTRWKPYSVQAEAGNVECLAGDWNAAYFDELEAAPNGTHDDQLDASATAFNDLALNSGTAVAGVKGR